VRVYIGWDEREAAAATVAMQTLYGRSGLHAQLLDAVKLADHGLLTRISDHRGGKDYDLISNANKSTRFTISRFLVPLLCQHGWALFVDCDVVFYRSPVEMLLEAKGDKAVYVVKHEHHPTEARKMVDQVQQDYPRKNWSSVVLWNCDHPANRRLSLRDINERPGRDLHRFYWLHDDEIGELGPEWNWLVNVEPKPANLGVAHFTLGGPWMGGWERAPHDELWLEAQRVS
jgi:hypothetical protein